MSTKSAYAAPVAILATIAAALSLSIATANPAGAEPHHTRVYTAHAQVISNPNKIFPGQVVNIPKSSKAYVVKRGDTLSGIAKKFGIGLAALEAANHVGPAPRGAGTAMAGKTATAPHHAAWHRPNR